MLFEWMVIDVVGLKGSKPISHTSESAGIISALKPRLHGMPLKSRSSYRGPRHPIRSSNASGRHLAEYYKCLGGNVNVDKEIEIAGSLADG